MRMRAKVSGALRADGPIAQGGTFGGAGDDANMFGHSSPCRTVVAQAGKSAPISKRSKRAVIGGAILVQQRAQRVVRIAEHDKALPLNQASIAVAESRGKFDEMRRRRIGILVTLMRMDRLPVFADEPLICQNATLRLCRG